MTVLTLLIAIASMLLSLLVAAALVEVHDVLGLLKDATGIASDEPIPMELGEAKGRAISDYPVKLPDVLSSSFILLLLSPSCAGCYDVGRSLRGAPSYDGMHVVVTAMRDQETARLWVAAFKLPSEVVTFDDYGEIAGSLGIDATPVAVMVKDGLIDQAMTVPSGKWFTEFRNEVSA